MVEKSIASFERTVISGNSPFDRWKYAHDEKAVNASVKRGFAVFTSKKKGNCAVCHTVGEKYALFTDNKFHNVGIGVDMGKITDPGRYAVTHDEADMSKFKTPSLRNVALTVMPSIHAYEMIRSGLWGGKMQAFYDVEYVSFILASLTLFGLWLVRDARRFIEIE